MRLENELLLASAARLYTMGLDMEGARETLRALVERGVPYDSPELLDALENFITLREQFSALEAEHIKLRDSL